MKILIVLLTHNEYLYCLPEIWKRVNELELPENSQVDKLIFAEDTENQIIKYAEDNSLPLEYFKTNKDVSLQKDILITCWTVEKLSRVVQLRNAYLKIAKQGDYDWLLQIDGDVLPPKDGLMKLLVKNKKYIGAAIKSKKRNIYYVYPDKVRMNKIYECSIIGNCFHLEYRTVFNFSYSCNKNKYNSCSCCMGGDMVRRNFLIRKSGIKIYCDPTIKCNHL